MGGISNSYQRRGNASVRGGVRGAVSLLSACLETGRVEDEGHNARPVLELLPVELR